MTALPPRIGPYAVEGELGRGGMGVVYLARDTRLGREVALKAIPAGETADRAGRERFLDEARALASLNHPNIATVYGLEDDAQGGQLLVLERIEGETLAARLARGPLPLAESLEIASQIAAGLEAAHERGVVHRDLKPANVMVTERGLVKILDFGIARHLAPGAGSTTLGGATTRGAEGLLLGTPATMSPEQARGRPVDARADVWSLGCTLYEMLAGRPAFSGETLLEILAAVLERQPDEDLLPPETPASVRHLLRACLEKDVERRMPSAREARRAIEACRTELRSQMEPAARTQRLRQATFADDIETSPSWSPDGEELVFCREVDGQRRLVRKRLVDGVERVLTRGAFDDLHPAWTPDGQRILFVRAREPGRLEPGDVFGAYENADLWSLDLATGNEEMLVEEAFHPDPSPDGTRIAVDASWAGPRRIWTVDARGRNPEQVTSETSEAVVHIRPRWSPDGRCLVFQKIERTKFDVGAVDLRSRTLRVLTDDVVLDLQPTWAASGRAVYFSSYRGGGINVWRIPTTGEGVKAGAPVPITTGAGQDVEVAVSRDGRRLAFATLRQNAHLWRLPLSPETGRATGPPEKVIATTREDSRGVWSPDGTRIAFNSDRSGDMNLWIHHLGDGSERAITRGPGGDYQPSWSPDGRRLAFFSSRGGKLGIWSVDIESGALERLSRHEGIDVNPAFSPDGSQIAFQSDRDGRLEVWLMNADGSDVRPLTRVGVMGHFLLWDRDGRRIVFRCPSGPRTLGVAVEGGEPEPLPEVIGGAHMSFSPDFTRILDVLGHKALWVSPLAGGRPEKVFEFDDPDVRIDYPRWSPDGRWVLFDRFRPLGGDIWVLEDEPGASDGT